MAVTERYTHSMPASRLAAELAHFTNVRRADVQFTGRIRLKVTDDGLCRTELKTIREFGWVVSGFTIQSNGVSIVRNDTGTDRPDYTDESDGGDA